MKTIKLIVVAFIIVVTQTLAQGVNPKQKLKVKDYVELCEDDKNPTYKEITIMENATLVVCSVVVVEKSLKAMHPNIKIKFVGKGKILLRGAESNILNPRIIKVSETGRLKGFKYNDHIKVWNLNGKLLVSEKFDDIDGTDFESNYYNIQVKGKGFRSNYFIGETK